MFVQNLLFPPVCALCAGRGTGGRDLCEACQQALPYNPPACAGCALPLAGGVHDRLCGRCQQQPLHFDGAFALLRYADPVRQLITGLKFHGRLRHARLLGDLMAEHLAARDLPRPACLVPVPLHPSRLRQRGYNQALELARPLAQRLQIPLDRRLCERIRATAAQADLPVAQRRANVRGAFVVRASRVPESVALIDDVLTTGHTVSELARVLRRAGVRHVQVWACARTASA